MINVDNNATRPAGLSNPSPEKLELGPKSNNNFESLVQQMADYNKNSSGDSFNDLSQRFNQDTAPISKPVSQAVNALVDKITGEGSSLDELLGQLVNSVKSGNPLSADTGMSDEGISNVAKELLGGLAGKSESSDNLLGQLVKSMHDATGNPMSDDTGMSNEVLSKIANAVLDGLAGKSESLDDLLGQLGDAINAGQITIPPDEGPGEIIYILPPNAQVMYGVSPPEDLPLPTTIEIPNDGSGEIIYILPPKI